MPWERTRLKSNAGDTVKLYGKIQARCKTRGGVIIQKRTRGYCIRKDIFSRHKLDDNWCERIHLKSTNESQSLFHLFHYIISTLEERPLCWTFGISGVNTVRKSNYGKRMKRASKWTKKKQTLIGCTSIHSLSQAVNLIGYFSINCFLILFLPILLCKTAHSRSDWIRTVGEQQYHRSSNQPKSGLWLGRVLTYSGSWFRTTLL